jgi:hypothetical protein
MERRKAQQVSAVCMLFFILGIPATILAQDEKTDTIVVTALLAEIPGKFAPNDLYDYVYIMKYRVIKVEKGKYAEKEILVGQYNPLIPRAKIKDKMDALVNGNADRFQVGVKHRLKLITPISAMWNDAIEDDYIDSELDKYFALQTDIIKK